MCCGCAHLYCPNHCSKHQRWSLPRSPALDGPQHWLTGIWRLHPERMVPGVAPPLERWTTACTGFQALERGVGRTRSAALRSLARSSASTPDAEARRVGQSSVGAGANSVRRVQTAHLWGGNRSSSKWLFSPENRPILLFGGESLGVRHDPAPVAVPDAQRARGPLNVTRNGTLR